MVRDKVNNPNLDELDWDNFRYFHMGDGMPDEDVPDDDRLKNIFENHFLPESHPARTDKEHPDMSKAIMEGRFKRNESYIPPPAPNFPVQVEIFADVKGVCYPYIQPVPYEQSQGLSDERLLEHAVSLANKQRPHIKFHTEKFYNEPEDMYWENVPVDSILEDLQRTNTILKENSGDLSLLFDTAVVESTKKDDSEKFFREITVTGTLADTVGPVSFNVKLPFDESDGLTLGDLIEFAEDAVIAQHPYFEPSDEWRKKRLSGE